MRYGARNPTMRIIDSMDAIRPIMSRLSMLAPFDDHGIHLKARPPPMIQPVDWQSGFCIQTLPHGCGLASDKVAVGHAAASRGR